MKTQAVDDIEELTERIKLLRAIGGELRSQTGTYFTSLQIKALNEINLRFQAWEMRTEFYLKVGPNFNPHIHTWWLRDGGINKRLKTINQALQALAELNASGTTENREEIANIIWRVIELELRKLEFKQFNKLGKDQDSLRDETTNIRQTLAKDKAQLSNDISEQKYSKSISTTLNPQLHAFLLQQESWRMSIKKFLKKSALVTDAGATISSVGGVVPSVNEAFPAMMQAGQIGGFALSAIPAIGAISVALPLIFTAIRSWLKNKSTTNRALSIATVGLVIGAMIVAAGIPVATAGIVCGLMAVGAIKLYVLPWWKTRKNIISKEKEVGLLEKRIAGLINKDVITDVSRQERHALLRHVENYVLANLNYGKQLDVNHLNALRSCIQTGDAKKINSHPLLNSILSASNHANLDEFLLDHALERKTKLDGEIKTLKKVNRDNFYKMMNGLIGVLGAVLVCIPTPPTIIAGAALFAITGVIGMSLKYNLHGKFGDFIRGKLKNETKETAPLIPQGSQNELNNEFILTATSTGLMKKQMPSHCDAKVQADSAKKIKQTPQSVKDSINRAGPSHSSAHDENVMLPHTNRFLGGTKTKTDAASANDEKSKTNPSLTNK